MAFLVDDDLKKYNPEAVNMTEGDKVKFLNRANSFAFGVIGGVPKYTPELPEEQLKAAVALAFEILAEGQEAQTNSVNGNITEAAPNGHYVRKAEEPLAIVEKMLLPYKEAFIRQNATTADNGIMFL
ncbi:hypothetical protein [Cytobacillus horneckiae]|uniref:hypothetical protein n=1 Tax=Cytobacillus horneckiae TaxID=549687 RepID=UPI003D9A7181